MLGQLLGITSVIKLNLKLTMIRSYLCDYSDAYIHVNGTITVPNTVVTGAGANNANKKVIFKSCAPFTNCINEINITQIDDAHDIDVVIPIYNLKLVSAIFYQIFIFFIK